MRFGSGGTAVAQHGRRSEGALEAAPAAAARAAAVKEVALAVETVALAVVAEEETAEPREASAAWNRACITMILDIHIVRDAEEFFFSSVTAYTN